MRRREFIAGLGGAVALPLVAQAQQAEKMRRIGILDVAIETDRLAQTLHEVMREELAKLGWIEGRSVRFDLRFSAGDPDRMRAHADELVRHAPDVIAATSLAATRTLLQRTPTIPIVFNNVGDPVAGGQLKNIERPEGNATGITSLFQSLAGKWLELLKEAAPRVSRVGLIFNPGVVGAPYFAVIDSAAEVLAVRAMRLPYRDAAELERAIDTFASEPNGGLVIVPPSPGNRELINRLTVKYRLPSISAGKDYAAEGGIMSYGSDNVEQQRVAASYVDRILRGAKVSDLPVQFPTMFKLVVNLKTAKAIGLTIPESFLLRADEVIE
jgi:putative ABC transport system substrate-binding protein